jgi:Protein of unknown function (DUF3551)
MKLLIRIVGTFALIVCIEKSAHAQNQPWCLFKDYAGGYADCRYATLQQCLADRLGTGSSCGPTPYPSSPEPRPYSRSPSRS